MTFSVFRVLTYRGRYLFILPWEFVLYWAQQVRCLLCTNICCGTLHFGTRCQPRVYFDEMVVHAAPVDI